MTEKITSRMPNALKHGVFAKTLFVFRGDPEEFAELHERLREEWQPEGVSEEDCVHTLATLYFRKQRLPLMLYLQRQKSKNQPTDRILDQLLNTDPAADPNLAWVNISKNWSLHHRPELDPLMQRVSDLLGISQSLFNEGTPRWVWVSLDLIAGEDSHYILDRIGTEDMRSSAKHRAAIKKIVDDELLPAARQKLREQVGQTDDDLVRAFDGMSSEEIADELALLEKIEQQIERRLTQLGRIRALKAMGFARSARRLNRSPAPIIDNDTHGPAALPPQTMSAPAAQTLPDGGAQGS